ncbi:hypothetical protein Tco_0221642 [Tanacetum coccineum]
MGHPSSFCSFSACIATLLRWCLGSVPDQPRWTNTTSYGEAAQTWEYHPYGQQVVVCIGMVVVVVVEVMVITVVTAINEAEWGCYLRLPAEGGDSETGGDGDGVVMARSLSTSASGGREKKA